MDPGKAFEELASFEQAHDEYWSLWQETVRSNVPPQNHPRLRFMRDAVAARWPAIARVVAESGPWISAPADPDFSDPGTRASVGEALKRALASYDQMRRVADYSMRQPIGSAHADGVVSSGPTSAPMAPVQNVVNVHVPMSNTIAGASATDSVPEPAHASSAVKAAWIGVLGVIVAAVVGGVFTVLRHPTDRPSGASSKDSPATTVRTTDETPGLTTTVVAPPTHVPAVREISPAEILRAIQRVPVLKREGFAREMYEGRWARWSGRVAGVNLPRSSKDPFIVWVAGGCRDKYLACVLLRIPRPERAKIESLTERDLIEYEGKIERADIEIGDRITLTDVTIISRADSGSGNSKSP